MAYLAATSRWLLAIALGCAVAAASAPQALAQSQGLVVRDGTLGSAPAGVVAPGADDLGTANYLIRADLGEQRGVNLFHSFTSFSIGSGERATFTDQGAPNPGAIENVIARVTGGSESRIEGELHSTIPGADLWLFNPSGVVFGQGARLEVPGTFHTSTADSLGFGADGLERFQADPSRPSVLSTARPAAFGFLSPSSAASLEVQGGLAFTRGEARLASGDVSLVGAEFRAPGGHLQLEAAGDVSLSDASLVDVGGETPGSISIRSGRLLMTQGSKLLAENESAGPAANPGEPGPGSISVAASESVLVDDSLLSVSTHGGGNAGTIRVASPEVTFQNGPGFDAMAPAQITTAGASAETTSSGAAGEIQIHAGELVRFTSGVAVSATAVGSAASGKAGSVEIAAQEVDLQGSRVSAETSGEGAGGSISIAAGAAVTVDDSLLSVNTWSAGQAGTILIAGLGEGLPSPKVTIQHGLGYLSDTDPVVTDRGVRAETTASGAAGAIEIDARTLELSHGVAVSADSVGAALVPVPRGDAGTVNVRANSLVVYDRSFIGSAGWGSLGLGGDIQIDLGDEGSLVVDGGPQATRYALIISSSQNHPGRVEIHSGAVTVSNRGEIDSDCNPGCVNGADGSVDIAASSIDLETGGGVHAETWGEGTAGDITLRAHSITIGPPLIDASGTHASGIHASATGGGAGKAGDITLDVDSLAIETQGVIDANAAYGPGDAGTITVRATDSISATNQGGPRLDPTNLQETSGIFSVTLAGGLGGSILLSAPRITITDGAIVASGTIGGGRGGGIELRGDRIRIVNGGFVDTTSVPVTPPGGVPISGDAGSLTLVADESIEVGGRSEFGELTSDRSSTLTSRVSSEGLGSGDAGAVLLRAPRIELFDGGTIAIDSANADGGDVTIQASKLVHLDAGVITASVTTGTGGNIAIDPQLLLLENSSRIEAKAGAGTGGNIQITADHYFAFPDSVVSVDADSELGIAGTVEIHSPAVNLAGTLTPLPTSYLDAASLIRQRCAARTSGERAGSFAARGWGGIAPEPDGWLPASFELASGPFAGPVSTNELASEPLPALASCR